MSFDDFFFFFDFVVKFFFFFHLKIFYYAQIHTMIGYKDVIEEGDLVLVFISREAIKPIIVDTKSTLNTRYGTFPHTLMIGKKYGSQISSIKGYGFVHLLLPTAELWTLSLPHRTQIVYTPDSSYITQRLGIRSGSRVIEAGTGSASFSHSLSRTVAPVGTLFSYEFHRPRFEEAEREFKEHKLTNVVINHKDVCKDGFEVATENHVNATAVFLDLPSPWEAIPHLNKVISQDEKVGICCFSPCIEQVIKTVEALNAEGWTSIEMCEVQSKRMEARQFMKRDVDDAIERLKDVKKRKLEGIEKKRKYYEEHGKSMESRSGEELLKEQEQTKVDKTEFNPFGRGLRIKEGDKNYSWINITKYESETKSHTSYLTFAFKTVSSAGSASS